MIIYLVGVIITFLISIYNYNMFTPEYNTLERDFADYLIGGFLIVILVMLWPIGILPVCIMIYDKGVKLNVKNKT